MKKLITTIPGHPNVHRIEKENGEVRFLKTSPNGQILREFSDYKLLSSLGLSVPVVRVLPDGHKLLMESAGVSVGDLFFSETELAFEVFNSAVASLAKVWSKTCAVLDEEKLQRNYSIGSSSALNIIGQTLVLPTHVPVIVNGKKYQSLTESVSFCREQLSLKKDVCMVVSHGDEYSLNIMAYKNGSGFTGQYKFIDPRESGFYAISSVLNILWGQTLLHTFSFDSSIEISQEAIFINYKIKPEQAIVYERFCSSMKKLFLEVLEEISKPALFSEYMFCNLARIIEPSTYLPKYQAKIHPNRFAFFGIAHQFLYDK